MTPLPEETCGGGAAAEGPDVAAPATEAEAEAAAEGPDVAAPATEAEGGYSCEGDAASAASLNGYEANALQRRLFIKLQSFKKNETFFRYAYPEAVSPGPPETGYNGLSLEGASSIAEIPYGHQDAQGIASNGYNDSNTNGGSVATSPTPYDTNGYNGNGYMGYSENGSIFSTNTNGNDNGSTVSGYVGNRNVRRRMLPAIPKGEKQCWRHG